MLVIRVQNVENCVRMDCENEEETTNGDETMS